MRPIAAKERIEVLDVLRGFAIFGILLVNMAAYNSPILYLGAAGEQWWTGTADRVAQNLIFYLARGKFVSMLSFLFGLGLALQLLRAEARGGAIFSVYRRRLLALLLFGVAHSFLLWPHDILARYALFGFLLLFLVRLKPRTVLVAALVLYTYHFGGWGLAEWRALGSSSGGESEVARAVVEVREQARSQVENSVSAYRDGSFAAITAQRAQDKFFQITTDWLRSAPLLLAYFLLGLYVGRRRWFQEITARLPLFRQVWKWGLLLGVSVHALAFLVWAMELPLFPARLLALVWFDVGVPGLCFFYVSTFVLALQREAWRRRLAPLAAVGRTALSNYLLQSLVCTTIFYSYGLGLYGQVGPALGLALTALIFALQIPLSMWWLRRFRFGPAEWLWRTLTYGKLQPMRVRQIAA